MPLLTARATYKPFEYPWAFTAWERQQEAHWLPKDIPLHEDVKQWASGLTVAEKHLLMQIFRFFTQADIEVSNCYNRLYAAVFLPPEISMMLTSFANMECFDKDTELLTVNGWKPCPEITDKDTVAQYDMATRSVSFVQPKKIARYAYQGIMHHYKSQTSDICVTPNHDMIARNPTSGKLDKVKSFARRLGSNYNYPVSGFGVGSQTEITSLDRLLIAVQADGCLRGNCPSAKNRNWRTVDFTLHKPRKIKRLIALLDACGLPFSKIDKENGRVRISFAMPDDIDITGMKTFRFLRLSSMSYVMAINVLDEIVFWDGTINVATGQRSYYSTEADAAGFVQAVACLTGKFGATIGVNRDKDEIVILPGQKDHVLTKTCYVVTFTDRTEKTYPHREEVEYDDYVYCVSVDTENLVSRRNGKVAFTGNTIHVAAYSHLLDTIGIPEVEYSAFLEYAEMKAKSDYMHEFGVDGPFNIAVTLAAFGAFTEGLQLFASFAILMNFPRFNKMKGMGQIVTYSIRDETLHCDSIIKLYHTFLIENPEINRHQLHHAIQQVCRTVVSHEDAFIALAFEMGDIEGLTVHDMKMYIRYIANRRLNQLGMGPMYRDIENPLPWLDHMVNAVEHANFFEAKATEYSRAATLGTWSEAFEGMMLTPEDHFTREQEVEAEVTS